VLFAMVSRSLLSRAVSVWRSRGGANKLSCRGGAGRVAYKRPVPGAGQRSRRGHLLPDGAPRDTPEGHERKTAGISRFLGDADSGPRALPAPLLDPACVHVAF
jgi:hypothetical protein